VKTVSNATPIISLSSIGKIELLRDIFQNIIIPQAVYDEIKAKQKDGYEEVNAQFIIVQSVTNTERALFYGNMLGMGEAQTIVLSEEIKADNTIIDENIGYAIAKDVGLNVIRTLSILLKAKELGLVSSVKPLIDEMILRKRWYSRHVYHAFLKKAGEI